MRASHRLRVVAVGTVCLLAFQPESVPQAAETHAQSKVPERRTFSIPAAMGRLVPPDAVGLVYVSSVEEMEADLALLDSLFKSDRSGQGKSDNDGSEGTSGSQPGELGSQPDARPQPSSPDSRSSGPDTTGILGRITGLYGVRPERIDRMRPLVVALTLVDLGQLTPLPVFVVPVLDREGVMDDVAARPGRPAPLSSGDYMSLALLPGYDVGKNTPPIATDLPARRYLLRLRTDRIMSILQPFVDQGLAKLISEAKTHGPDSGAAPQDSVDAFQASRALDQASARFGVAMMQWTVGLIRSWEKLDLGVEIANGQLDIDYTMWRGPDSQSSEAQERARGLVDLARCLPKEYAFLSLAAIDWAGFMDAIEPAYMEMIELEVQKTPAKMQADYLSWTKTACEISRQFQQTLTAVDFGDRGLEMVMVAVVDQPVNFLQQNLKILESPVLPELGLHVEFEDPRQIEGVEVQGYRMRFDLAKMNQTSVQLPKQDKAKAEMSPQEAGKIIARVFGADGMTVRMAAIGDKFVSVLHPDPEPMTRVVTAVVHGKGQLPANLQAFSATQDPLCLWSHGDLRHLLASAATLAVDDSSSADERQAVDALSTGKPVTLSMYGTAGKKACAGTLHLEVAGLADLIEELENLPGGIRHHLERAPDPVSGRPGR